MKHADFPPREARRRTENFPRITFIEYYCRESVIYFLPLAIPVLRSGNGWLVLLNLSESADQKSTPRPAFFRYAWTTIPPPFCHHAQAAHRPPRSRPATHRHAPRRDRRTQPTLLSGRRADDHRPGIRRPLPRVVRPRNGASRIPHRRLADPTRRRRTAGGVHAGPPPRADAQPGQHVLGGRGDGILPPRAKGAARPRRARHHRAEDRRRGRVALL